MIPLELPDLLAIATRVAEPDSAVADELDQSYQRRLEMLQKVRRGIADTATARKRLEHQLDKLRRKSTKLHDQERKAREAGRDEHAQDLQALCSGIEKQIADLQEHHATLSEQEQKLMQGAQRLQEKTEHFQARRETVKATAGFAEVIGTADLDAIDATLEETKLAGEEPAVVASALLHGLVSRRPFPALNRRIAVAATVQLLALNDWDLQLEPVEEINEALDGVARGTQLTRLADTIRTRLRPLRTQPGVSTEEIGENMFERFTDRARRVIVLAQEEARALNHAYIGTEHILLGLIREGEGVAAKALERLDIALQTVRTQVFEMTAGQGEHDPPKHIPFTPRAKKVCELALREALQMNHNYIGTEHILLGLIREGEGLAAQVLVKLGADLGRVRQEVIQLLSGYKERTERAVREWLHEEDAGSEDLWLRMLTEGEVRRWLPPPERTTGGRRSFLLRELVAVLDENNRLHGEVTRLRDLLRQHDIDPDKSE